VLRWLDKSDAPAILRELGTHFAEFCFVLDALLAVVIVIASAYG
jgi:hypothetical protein